MSHDAAPLTFHSAMHRGVLRVEVRGSGSYANTVAYWQAIAEQVNERQPHSLLLVDETTGPALGADEWFSLVQAMAGSGLESVRIAHVKPRGLERIEYCEIYAGEAGMDARVFVSEDEAERWLRYSESGRQAS